MRVPGDKKIRGNKKNKRIRNDDNRKIERKNYGIEDTNKEEVEKQYIDEVLKKRITTKIRFLQ